MCGILAIVDPCQMAAASLIRGADSLWHRGPNAWGLATYDPEARFSVYKAAHPPHQPPDGFDPSALPGTYGIAHTRYATTSSKVSLVRDAQPLVASKPACALAFNGHLRAESLKPQLEERGWSFLTNNDAEALLDALCDELTDRRAAGREGPAEEWFARVLAPSVTAVMHRLDGLGSYAAVCVLPARGVIAFRDPHGF